MFHIYSIQYLNSVFRMRIVAVADVHSPRFLNRFREGLDGVELPDLFLLAGDIVNRGKASEFSTVLDSIKEKLGDGYPIITCFGNEEYAETRNQIISSVGDRITILDEKSIILNLQGIKVGIVGTQGSLDKPTNWQRNNVPGIKEVFARRADRAAELLKKLSGKVDRRILLMHYSPCLETCEGEDNRDFAWLGSRKFFSVIKNEQPDLVVHGHVHNSTTHQAVLDQTLVWNVSLPAVGSVTELNLWN